MSVCDTSRGFPKPAGVAGKIFARRALRKWRAFSLLFIHVLFAFHFLHWKLNGKTLAPLEFSETLHTLHEGVLTAGFFFTLAALLATLLFGRFFCGWGCHILALQDACAWLLSKAGLKPKPVRSRVMASIPLGVFLYLYAWPQLERVLAGRPQPPFVSQSDIDGWSSYVTQDLFRAMPGLTFTVLTLLVCGFLIVYFLGSRSFCYSVCPYGVFLGWADRVSPAGRLVLKGGCENCGLCTQNCKSGVKVIQELKQFGTVVDSNCLKSLDCVAGCPQGAIGLGFKTPAAFLGNRKTKRAAVKPRAFDFTWGEEAVFLAVFAVLFIIYRGLYEIGILLAGAIAVLGGVGVVGLIRRARGSSRPWGPFFRPVTTASQGAWGASALCLAILISVFTLHSAFVHYHAYQGERLILRGERTHECARHLRLAYDWGLYKRQITERQLALVYGALGEIKESNSFFAKYLHGNRIDIEAQVQYGSQLERIGRTKEADREFGKAIVPDHRLRSRRDKRWRGTAHSLIAQTSARNGDTVLALIHLAKAIQDNPEDISHHCNIGVLRLKMGDKEGARQVLLSAEKDVGPSHCSRRLLQLMDTEKK